MSSWNWRGTTCEPPNIESQHATSAVTRMFTVWAFLTVTFLLLLRVVEAGFLSPRQLSAPLAFGACGILFCHSFLDSVFWRYCVGEDSPEMKKLRAVHKPERDKSAQMCLSVTLLCGSLYHFSKGDHEGAIVTAIVALSLFLLNPSQGKYTLHFINVFCFNYACWYKCGGSHASFLWSPVLILPIWNLMSIESVSVQVASEMWRLSAVLYFCSETELGLAISLLSVTTITARVFKGQHDFNLLVTRRADRRISEFVEADRRKLLGVLSHEIRNRLDILTNLGVEAFTKDKGEASTSPIASPPANAKALVEQTALMQKSVSVVLDLLDIEQVHVDGGPIAVEDDQQSPLPKTARVNLSMLIHSAHQLQLGDDSVMTDRPFHVQIDGSLQNHVLFADKDRLHLILCHLIANAFNGCADARDAKVTVRAFPQRALAPEASSSSCSSVVFEVVNAGQRHSQELLDDAMRRHVQKNSRVRRWGGHGLGLRHVKAILNQLQCPPLELTAHDNSVTARFVVPCEEIQLRQERARGPTPDSTRTAPTATTAASASATTESPDDVALKNILVVDDVALIRRLTSFKMKKKFPGINIVEAENGTKAVNIYRQRRRKRKRNSNGVDFDLVVMDIQMPVLCGDEAVRRIRALEKQYQWPRALIMARTANTSQSDYTHYEACGMDGCIPKVGNVATQISKAVQLKRLRPTEFIIM